MNGFRRGCAGSGACPYTDTWRSSDVGTGHLVEHLVSSASLVEPREAFARGGEFQSVDETINSVGVFSLVLLVEFAFNLPALIEGLHKFFEAGKGWHVRKYLSPATTTTTRSRVTSWQTNSVSQPRHNG